jgi:hypothetical protein
MKKNLIAITIGFSAFFGMFSAASAQYNYSYNNNYSYNSTNNNGCYYSSTYGRTFCTGYTAPASYSYTKGCYTYYYDGSTRSTSITSYNCQTTTYTSPSYYYYTTPSYSNYQYSNYSWYPSSYYSNYTNTNYSNYGYYNNYLNYSTVYPYYVDSTYYTPTTYMGGCYWQSGYQVCY